MKYELYHATDTRDNQPMLWLLDSQNARVALFCTRTAPSRIKHRTAAAPEGIVWEPLNSIDRHTVGVLDMVAEWEMP